MVSTKLQHNMLHDAMKNVSNKSRKRRYERNIIHKVCKDRGKWYNVLHFWLIVYFNYKFEEQEQNESKKIFGPPPRNRPFKFNLPKFSCNSVTICLLFSLSMGIRHNCAPSYVTGASSSFVWSAKLLGTHITALNTQERNIINSFTFIFPNLQTGNKWFSQDHCHHFIR